MAANTFAVTGHAENKQITELLPGILNQVCDAQLICNDVEIVRYTINIFVQLIINPVTSFVVGC